MKKMKKADGYWILESFANQPGLIQGFSTRKSGNLKVRSFLNSNKDLDQFLSKLKIGKGRLVMMEQVHGNQIEIVGNGDQGKVIKGVDGLITSQKGIFLGVNTADCLPLFFYDRQKKIIGIAHAGWEGILSRIGQKMVGEMKERGADPQKIIVGIGPHIGSCCYLVGDDLVKKFRKEFGNLAKMISQDKKGIHLDLLKPTLVQLIKSGIRRENIEVPLICTACQNNDFFSYRQDNQKTYGEMLGVIGWN